MKLPKELPLKLIYVLMIILVWTRIVESYTNNEDFDMKQLNDVKDMLMNKMNFGKEKFGPYDPLTNENMNVQPWLSYHGAPFDKSEN